MTKALPWLVLLLAVAAMLFGLYKHGYKTCATDKLVEQQAANLLSITDTDQKLSEVYKIYDQSRAEIVNTPSVPSDVVPDVIQRTIKRLRGPNDAKRAATSRKM